MQLTPAATNPTTTPRYALLDPAFPKDPYPLLRRMRAEDPVYWFAPLRCWVLTRHEDVAAVLKDPVRFSSRRAEQMLAGQLPDDTPPELRKTVAEVVSLASMFADPPAHTFMRSEANKGFSQKAMAAVVPRIHALTGELIDAVSGRGAMDGFLDLFQPFASTIIADVMGVPRADMPLFLGWTSKTTQLLGGAELTVAEVLAAMTALQEMNAYLVAQLAERRVRPRDDMMSFLVAGMDEARFPLPALAGMCAEIIGGANAPTGDALGNALVACLAHPAEVDKARRDPSLWPNAVLELLRYDGPVVFWSRLATEDVALGGQTIRSGDMVYVSLAGANRDPRVFADPDRLDFARENASRHVSFSLGPHHCIGAGLARMEMAIVLETLFRRMPGLRLAGPLRWREGSISTRGPQSIPLAF